MPAKTIEVSTFANIPSFVPVGVFYTALDTGLLYAGTGATSPNVTQVGGGSVPVAGALSLFTPSLPNTKLINVTATVTSTANQTLYTCPAKRRAMVFGQSGSWTFSNRHASLSSALTTYFSVSTWTNNDGNPPAIAWFTGSSTAHNVITSQPAAASGRGMRILEAGDKLYCSASQQPYSVWTTVVEFDNTANVKSINSADISTAGGGVSTNQLIYTSPSSGNGSLVFAIPGLTASNTSEGSMFMGTNMSGNSDTTSVYPMNVPNGQSAGATFQIAAPVSLLDGGASTASITAAGLVQLMFLSPNDKIYFNTDGLASGNVYVSFNVVEI